MTALGTLAPARARSGSAAARLTAALLILIAGVNVLYLIALSTADGPTGPVLELGLSLATQWLPAAVFWIVAVRTRFTRLPVVLAAAGITASAIGDSYYTLAMDADGYLASPSLADPAYLLFYPLLVAALVALVRDQLRGVGRLVLLEAAVATVGVSAVLAIVLDPVIHDALTGDDPLASAVAISYPLFDLVLLAVIAGVASAPSIRLGARWWALIAGLVVTAVGDVAYALLGTVGTYLAGTPLDATWAVGVALMAWWGAGMAEPATATATAARQRATLPLPAVAVVAGLLMLVVATQVPLSLLAVVLAALTVGLGAAPLVFRQAVLGRMLAAQEESVRRMSALDQAKTDMLVTMNHEFRTPLTSITGHVDLLLDDAAGELPESAVGTLRTIERNAERLQTLLDETLTASRLEQGRDLLARERHDLAEVVERARERAVPLAAARGVELVRGDVEPGLVVAVDTEHLERAFGTVLDNALKFSPAGSRVVLEVRRDGRARSVVRVRDEGIGIPAEDIPSVTTRFFRASNVQRAAIPGVGLGLSIAEQVVRAHGGTLEIESELGRGTDVAVRLPLARG